ncbi:MULTISPECIES: glycosyltransferase [Bacillaceae]|uniref:tetratricopeptide repeat-containing glycosyltransferase n=1 Tax=Bacillaceae TaxID=186817 RepID=UPI001E3342CD|nr:MULTISPECIES: glycosyltransferase [Bacillaceae]MCE4047678.1 glycosyltransferase [Bacillus sp. Au-Bac7]MCM3031125.1 glycosyltransferase [Niallia sp. MER 6]MDL0434701.1 glycosyltransferase [Niallia sp. SS-2023]UPO89549.1 glycosyltransferase [Niallia sp. Man26]
MGLEAFTKSITLCMIVKNESKIITRCLDSAEAIIDSLSICDTGSTDDTVKIIKNWAKDNGKECTIHHTPFQNFGYNRTLSVNLAQGAYPDSDYLLLLDADMILQNSLAFHVNNLKSDQYLIMQMNQDLKYWNTRLIHAKRSWECVGVTHEYWELKESPATGTVGKLENIFILDKEDGGSKQDKFERDKRLLEEAVQDENQKPLWQRYMFYLAQTYYDLQDYSNAIEWYKKRIAEGGWQEEVYYSMLKIGLAYEQLANRSSVNLKREELLALSLFRLQQAWMYRPSRGEAIYHLARIHRELKNYQLAYLFAAEGKSIPFPANDLLFVDYTVHDYRFDCELAIAGFYIEKNKLSGKQALERLLARKEELPRHLHPWLEQTSQYYH